MKEYQVIMHLAKHLKNKNWTIKKISVNKKDEREEIRNRLHLDRGIFQKGEDIMATAFGGKRKILIEAKGGTYNYGIYTALGQMVCTLDGTRRNWFGLAFPQEWASPLQKRIEKSAVLRLIIADAQKKDKRLYFYFVNRNGDVEQKTWNKLLKS